MGATWHTILRPVRIPDRPTRACETDAAEDLLTPTPALLDALPTGTIDVQDLPEELARSLFEALRLEIRYNRTHHRATYRITLVGQP
ncbi:hypothetical protein ACFWM1_16835 [Nocardia sp. NPDC058379]|uniref:hypothetical protein n=1 Tax=unclassified Nocardia TaxID=2637762 RepID=UPI00364CFE7B